MKVKQSKVLLKKVLCPYLQNKEGITGVKSILLTTNKKKNAKGGMLSYNQVLTDLNLLRKTALDNNSKRNIFTTMFDFYALPKNFPGFYEMQKIQDPYLKVDKLEKDFAKAINDKRFIPYIQLHEFETLLFCDIECIAKFNSEYEEGCKQLVGILEKVGKGNPELINHGMQTAPSKRIEKAIGRYNKPRIGKGVTELIGIDQLRSKCKHFNQWIEKLISY